MTIGTDLMTLGMIVITSCPDTLTRTRIVGSMMIFLNLTRAQGLLLCAYAAMTNEQGNAIVDEVFAPLVEEAKKAGG